MKARAYNGHYVHYIQEGNGPPVIMIHGVAGSHHHWKYLRPELATAGFQVFALDLLGHGKSEKPECNGTGYHIEAIYAHLANWISHLELKQPPILIGHSMGAYLMLLYAIRNPGKVRGMVLVSPFYNPKQLSGLLRLSLRGERLSTKVLRVAPAWTISSAMALTKLKGEQLSRADRKQLALDFKRSDPRVITFPKTTQDLSPYLKRIKERVLVVWGKSDLTLSPKSYPALVDALPNALACPLPGGHNIHLTHPAFNQHIIQFANQLFVRQTEA